MGQQGTLWLLNAATGEPVYRLKVGETVVSDPVLIDNRLYLLTNRGKLLAYLLLN
jgi:outer membrane protein assembly factor BamB